MFRKYDLVSDSGHGWLQVDLSELKELGLLNKISGYSYISASNKVYLEEDCDAGLFIDAKGLKKEDINHIYYDGDCFIRELEHYSHD